MSLESGTFVADLVETNPPGTDKKKQGDDHLRLIKNVLKATFPSASKAFYLPTSQAKSASFNVLATDMNKCFVIDTTAGAHGATMPTLAAGDAGWECTFIKSNTGTNPYFILPPSGTIQSGEVTGLTKTRRCIPGHRTRVLWTGSAFIAERVPRLPLGTILDVPVSGLPVGYEWANGQTLTSASVDYPEYYGANGNSAVVPDRRGRAPFGRDDMGGGIAGRITIAGSAINGQTLGASGGAEGGVLIRSNLPNDEVSIIIDSGQGSHKHTYGRLTTSSSGGIGGIRNVLDPETNPDTSFATLPAMVGHFKLNDNANVGVTQTAVNKMNPAMITNMIVVVE